MSTTVEGPPPSLYFEYPTYELRRPAEVNGVAPLHPVVVVGGGPVGMAIAILLAQRGVPATVVEAGTTVGYGSRAGSLSRHSLEVLEPLGVMDAVLQKALPYTGGYTFFRDKKVFEFSMLDMPGDRYPPMIKLQQCYLEKFLADQIEGDPRVEVHWDAAATGLSLLDDEVDVAVSGPFGDYTLRASYVVAADGARSTVRKLLGLELTGATYPAWYVIADIQFESSAPVGRRVWFDPPSNPDATVIMHRQPDDIWRVDYQVGPGIDPREEAQEANVRQRIDHHMKWIGETAPWELDWVSLYQAHGRVLDSLRHGRVLLAGDAAHLVPIFGVRGLNGGLADAGNLGWKLARVVKGSSSPTLLDSYDVERRHAACENIRQAHKSTSFMSPTGTGGRAVRDAVLRLSVDHEFVRGLLDPRQSRPIGYPDSPLHTVCEASARVSPAVGDPLPNVRLSHPHKLGGYLHQLLGPEFTVVRFATRSDGTPLVEDVDVGGETVRRLTVPWAASDRPESDFEEVAGHSFLVRPDRHVAASWAGDNIDLPGAMARATGRPEG